jgi:hypothetical protein
VVVSAHPEGVHYRAFLSYSHRDASFAARLHRRLEAYVLPSRLGANRRLSPIFKDREELPAARDLSDQVRAALAASDCLIVACSPAAAASPWVAREIETFRTLHPGRPILAALIQGEPTEAFPAALYEGGAEPLAADFRKDGDGDRLAFLKLVAGIAGVGVDQLIQRDAQRRLRGVMAVTAVALVAVVAMGGMTFVALEARAEAERQRAEAEGLVQFMITDLRARLKGVGDLSVLQSVNDKALAYYEGKQPDQLPQSSQLLLARLLHAKGEEEELQGDREAAGRSWRRAGQLTGRLYRQSPDNSEVVWTDAQSRFWLGKLAYLHRSSTGSREHWLIYQTRARKFSSLAPQDNRAPAELAYSEGAMCTLHVELDQDKASAKRSCQTALDLMFVALKRSPDDPGLIRDVATRLGWLAQAQVLNEELQAARLSRLQQVAMLERLLANDPRNAEVLQDWGSAQRGLTRIAYLAGKPSLAKVHLEQMKATFGPLAQRDPSNKVWFDQLAYVVEMKKYLENRDLKNDKRR